MSKADPVVARVPPALSRIMIVGQPGSGKSTLARQLGARTGLPVIHIDKIHWQPGWVERTKAEKTRLCIEAEQGEHWIFEGGHSSTWPTRVARADMVIWIDRSTGIRMWRVIRRVLLGIGRTRPDMADGCPERLRSLPEFLRFIWTTRNSGAAKVARLMESAPASCQLCDLRSDQEVQRFIQQFTAV